MTQTEKIRAQHRSDVKRGQRFRFGRNWRRFLKHLDDERLAQAEQSLRDFLELDNLTSMTFLDVGSGSGLFSLAARRLGATVHSFDYDTDSVACTVYLKDIFFADDENWTIEQGSALDSDYLASLGQFDVVYAWGVLHHTGDMWRALELVKGPVNPGGRLFISIYNDCDEISLEWLERKKRYCTLPLLARFPYALWVWTPIEWGYFLHYLRTGKPGMYLDLWRDYKATSRGMSRWYDMIDWLGGFPYEFAKAEDIVQFFEKDGYRLEKLAPNNGYGCHQLLLTAKQ
jgi:2-polyprenyl-6-hydroxyphenyl methylase/3-demethylubiquinone-9 3-methyltransferase